MEGRVWMAFVCQAAGFYGWCAPLVCGPRLPP
jgi:hypothetical protein